MLLLAHKKAPPHCSIFSTKIIGRHQKVTKMLDNASATDAFNAKTTLGGKTTTYTSSWFS